MSQSPRNQAPHPYVSSRSLSYEDVRALPRQDLHFDWHGAEVTPPVRYSVAFDPESVWLFGERSTAPQCDRSLTTGSFVEELWKQEVIELFLAEDTDTRTRYREFNLSPVGAWWSACFSSYRTVALEVSNDELKRSAVCWSSTTGTPSSWSACLKVPVGTLGINIDCKAPPRLNVTAVVPVPGSAEPHYLSAHAFEGKPDFHLIHKIPVYERVPS